ncbi:hypothetical protein HHL08_00270 [Sphingobium sp. AR-3-1]|uniref:Uncharacterized protein n=1 Tax=Sphingobium psychrophilum TaxID=2728834 RepID=A0A7X9WRM5_9SPHN|nr:hypothetical protein [Sphingobium psychrophilum]NML08592.1 hypothetical protein [Sphingobium psychrophilum]
MRRFAFLLLAGLSTPALADPISATKSVSIVSDPMGNLIPRAIPGAVVDYSATLANPLTNFGKTVRGIAFEEPLPANVILRVSDLGASGSGPVLFTNGAIILGVGDSGLAYSFTSLDSTTDGIEFSNGASWAYIPVPDADGYDANVRAIRIKPVTTFKTGGSFTVRFRVKLR